MLGVRLIVVLGFFIREHEVQADLIGLIDYGPMAGNHFANVELQDAGDIF
jgi:hypothetical protein